MPESQITAPAWRFAPWSARSAPSSSSTASTPCWRRTRSTPTSRSAAAGSPRCRPTTSTWSATSAASSWRPRSSCSPRRWFLERRLAIVACASYLLFSVPHAIYHYLNLGPYDHRRRDRERGHPGGDGAPPDLGPALVLRAPPGLSSSGGAAAPPGGNARIAGVPGEHPQPAGPARLPRLAPPLRRGRRPAAGLRPSPDGARRLLGASSSPRSARTLVDARLKHLAEIRVAMISGCEWCLDFGSAISAEAGVSEEDLRELPDLRVERPLQRAREAGARLRHRDLAAARSTCPTGSSTPREHLDEAQLVELTSIIALENYRSALQLGLRDRGPGLHRGRVLRPAGRAAQRAESLA